MPCFAADEQGEFVVKGVGARSCAEFADTAARGGQELAQYFGYVNGYTSAYNEISDNTFDIWRWQTTDTVLLLLLQRCKREPQQNFGAMLAALTRYLQDSRIDSKFPLVRIGTEDAGFYVYRPVYDEILAALKSRGYSTDDPYAALMQYKNDEDVPSTRNLHQMLLLRLLSTPEQ